MRILEIMTAKDKQNQRRRALMEFSNAYGHKRDLINVQWKHWRLSDSGAKSEHTPTPQKTKQKKTPKFNNIKNKSSQKFWLFKDFGINKAYNTYKKICKLFN